MSWVWKRNTSRLRFGGRVVGNDPHPLEGVLEFKRVYDLVTHVCNRGI